MGDNTNISEVEKQQKLQIMSPAERKATEERMKQLKGHPTQEDLNNAKKFAKSLI